jgi:GT2 family glycosyltransferase
MVALVDRLRQLVLGHEDTVTVVDNTPGGAASVELNSPSVGVVRAPQRQSSYHARNRGAAAGHNPWLLFIDADVDPVPDLLDRYFAVAPASETGVLVGGVRDVPASGNQAESLASRYACIRRLIDQSNTVEVARPYAQTANCAIRRDAFDHVGGFVDDIRSGGDADLCFRVRDAGWELEQRPDAVVEHHARHRLLSLLRQRARHGSGAEWLERHYPGFAGPRQGVPHMAGSILHGVVRSSLALVRNRPDEALTRVLDPVVNAAFQLGRRFPNTTRQRARVTGDGRQGR